MKVLVLFSGGLDSTTMLARAINKYGANNVIALSLYYGQKHKKEIEHAEKIAKYYGIKRHVLDVKQIFKKSDCALLKGSVEQIKNGSYKEQQNINTYVPFRNGLFISVATVIAISLQCGEIYYGAHKDDAGAVYPDCSVNFHKSISDAVFEGSGGQVKLIAPFIEKTKADIVAQGLKMDVPYELTWSCYKGEEKPCGQCATCIDRKKAFEANKTKDPLKYEN